MNLSKIIALLSRLGLYEMNAQTRAFVMGTSLIDGKKITTNDSVQISLLGDIKVNCIWEEILLTDMFEKIYASESGSLSRVSPKFTAVDSERNFLKS